MSVKYEKVVIEKNRGYRFRFNRTRSTQVRHLAWGAQ